MQTPGILSWKTQADSGNIYNTPNIFAIWALECITADLLAKGGLVTAGDRAKRRADLVSSLSMAVVHGTYASCIAFSLRQLLVLPATGSLHAEVRLLATTLWCSDGGSISCFNSASCCLPCWAQCWFFSALCGTGKAFLISY